MEPELIRFDDLSVGFTSRDGRLLPVLRHISLAIAPGETVGLVGESGSGKSTLALAAMGYLKRGLKVISGTVTFAEQHMFSLGGSELERSRGGKLALIPQNSGQSLTPTLRIGAQLTEALRLHSELDPAQFPSRILDLLRQVRLPDPEAIIARFPHELSGGQQQRVAIAMALAGEPKALLLDEPTTGLDVTTQAHILDLLSDIAQKSGMAMVYVSHDLGAIARVCQRVVVMYAGEIVLEGTPAQTFKNPTHPYARGLLASIPRVSNARLPVALEGRPPAPGEAGQGCAFADRCPIVQPLCRLERPELRAIASGEWLRCHVPELAQGIAMEPMTAPAPVAEASSDTTIVTLSELAISYHQANWFRQLLGQADKSTPTVKNISLTLARGETLGLVGESGSGKSTILKALAGLTPRQSGTIAFDATEDLAANVDHRQPDQRRRIQLVFQNPDESLNPRQTVAEILAQPLRLYFGLSGQALRDRMVELLIQVRLGAHYLDRLPSQMSGGEKQRVAIARAFAAEPDVVLCDEVTSALDVSVQAAVLTLLDRLRRERNTAYICVSHDLAVVRALADRVAVLYQGRLCEIGRASDVYANPAHPYTQVLLSAILEPELAARPKLMAADVQELSPPAKGCAFQRRCPLKIGMICETETPPWQTVTPGHSFACHKPDSSMG